MYRLDVTLDSQNIASISLPMLYILILIVTYIIQYELGKGDTKENAKKKYSR